MEKKTGDIMNAVVTTLVILVASVVLGTAVILYGTSLFNEGTNSTSVNTQIVKPVVNYHKQGTEPTVETGAYTEKSSIVAIDSQTYKFLLTNGETIDTIGTNIVFYNRNNTTDSYGVGTVGINNYYDAGYKINDLAGSKVIVYYSVLKPTCVYVFDWSTDFHSTYKVDGFNFTQIPNSTNYDFVPNQPLFAQTCDDTIKDIKKVEVFVK